MTEAYVTLATNDRYALGALVLAHSLRRVNTTKQTVILITPGVSDSIRSQLSNVFNDVVFVDVMDSNDSAHLTLLKRPELGVTFTKLHCWALTQYTKCVFLDADMLAVQNSDELFEQPELSAVPDVGWPDCFNSGLFVFTPSLDTYTRLLEHAQTEGSFDGGDQGLLNTFFTDWNRLSFIYNMVASVTYTYLPAYKQFGKDVKLVHFLGATKPWQQTYHVDSGTVVTKQGQEYISSHLNAWWYVFSSCVKPQLPESVSTPLLDVVTTADGYKLPMEAHEYELHTHDTHSTPHNNEYEHFHTNEQQVMMKREGYFPAQNTWSPPQPHYEPPPPPQPQPHYEPPPPPQPHYEPPPSPQPHYEPPPSPQPHYEAPPSPQPHYEAPPPPQPHYEAPPPPQPHYEPPPSPQPHYEAPPPPQPHYEAPPPPQPHYEAPPPPKPHHEPPSPQPHYQAPSPSKSRKEPPPASKPRKERPSSFKGTRPNLSHKETQTCDFIYRGSAAPNPPARDDRRLGHKSERRKELVEVHVSDSQSKSIPSPPPSLINTRPTSSLPTSVNSKASTTLSHSPFPSIRPSAPLSNHNTTTTTTTTSAINGTSVPPSPRPFGTTQTNNIRLSSPTKVVPELRHANVSASKAQSEDIPQRRQAFGMGRSGRVPEPARLGRAFQPFLSARLPSPFSGHRTARAVSANRPASELPEQLEGLNLTAEESIAESRKRWEQGIPDYRGEDAFDNILAHIDSKLKEN